MLFIDFRFVRLVEANPVYEADVTNGEVAEAVDNGDLVLARMPVVIPSGPNAGRTIGYETIPGVVSIAAPGGLELRFHSVYSQGDFISDPEMSAATDKIVVSKS